MVAIFGPGGPSMATKIATNGPGGPVVAGDHLRRDSTSLNRPMYNVLWDLPLGKKGHAYITLLRAKLHKYRLVIHSILIFLYTSSINGLDKAG